MKLLDLLIREGFTHDVEPGGRTYQHLQRIEDELLATVPPDAAASMQRVMEAAESLRDAARAHVFPAGDTQQAVDADLVSAVRGYDDAVSALRSREGQG